MTSAHRQSAGTHEEGKLRPTIYISKRRSEEGDRCSPLMQEVSEGVNDIRLAELTLNESHDMG